jgi:enamine deaminase RidA (YjgF/YER057c/UK114 family)
MFHVKRISTGSPFEATLGYSRAVVKGGWCFVSGVTGYDYKTMTIPDDARSQAENCFATIRDTLSKADFALEDVVRVQYTVVNAGIVDQIAETLGRVFGEIRPAATMVLAGLIKPEMLLEIEVTAFKG